MMVQNKDVLRNLLIYVKYLDDSAPHLILFLLLVLCVLLCLLRVLLFLDVV